MASITSTVPRAGVASTHQPTQKITIDHCDERTIKVFAHFQGELNACRYFRDQPHVLEGTKNLAASIFLGDLEELLKNPATKHSAVIASALFTPLLTRGLDLSEYNYHELDIALTTVLSGDAYLERQAPIQADSSRHSPAVTERDSSPATDRSSRQSDSSPLTTRADADSEIEEELGYSDDAPAVVPEEDIDYPDDFHAETVPPPPART